MVRGVNTLLLSDGLAGRSSLPLVNMSQCSRVLERPSNTIDNHKHGSVSRQIQRLKNNVGVKQLSLGSTSNMKRGIIFMVRYKGQKPLPKVTSRGCRWCRPVQPTLPARFVCDKQKNRLRPCFHHVRMTVFCVNGWKMVFWHGCGCKCWCKWSFDSCWWKVNVPCSVSVGEWNAMTFVHVLVFLVVWCWFLCIVVFWWFFVKVKVECVRVQ